MWEDERLTVSCLQENRSLSFDMSLRGRSEGLLSSIRPSDRREQNFVHDESTRTAGRHSCVTPAPHEESEAWHRLGTRSRY